MRVFLSIICLMAMTSLGLYLYTRLGHFDNPESRKKYFALIDGANIIMIVCTYSIVVYVLYLGYTGS
jgi:hypothetical protein